MEIESKRLRNEFGYLKCFWFVQGYPLIVIGPHWPLFLCFFTLLFLLGIFLVFYASVKISIINSLVGFVVFSFMLSSYLCAALLNPGIEMERAMECDLSVFDSSNYCSICDVNMKPKTEHCKECNICIQEYDHHCPWTSKCIGKGNLVFFYMFLTGILVCFMYGIFTMAFQPKVST